MNIGELTKNNSLAQIALPKLPRKAPSPLFKIWSTQDGKNVAISDMKDSHLANCIVMLRKKCAVDLGNCGNAMHCYDKLIFELVPSYYYLVAEAKRRLEKNRPAPEPSPRRKFRL